MKNVIIVTILLFTMSVASAQTAVNFTCNDCSGVTYVLFTELDAGKVIIIDWVMPCGACVGPTLTTYNVANSFQSSHPGRVFFYMADDYANSSCPSVVSWANQIGVPESVWSRRFSNSAIRMLDYGSTGMPKIVVLGGPNHTVFYNANNTVNITALQNAITSALSATGVEEENALIKSLNVFPNPANELSTINFSMAKPAQVTIELFDLTGKKKMDVYNGFLPAGERNTEINTSRLSAGVYLLKLSVEDRHRYINLVVAR